jgi:hypothetical protein
MLRSVGSPSTFLVPTSVLESPGHLELTPGTDTWHLSQQCSINCIYEGSQKSRKLYSHRPAESHSTLGMSIEIVGDGMMGEDCLWKQAWKAFSHCVLETRV